MNPRVKKWIVRPFLILLTALAMLTGIGLLLLTTQQQRLVNMAVKKVNDQFKGELTIEASSLSPFKHFPYVSIALHNARLFPDKTKTGKPIGELERLYVGFSLPDILRQKYTIKRLFLRGGYLNIVRQADSTVNLLEAIRMTPDTTSAAADTSASEVNVEKIVMKEIDVAYLDETTGRMISTHLDKLTSSFSMDSSQLTVGLKGDMRLDITSPSDTTFFRHKQVAIDLKADYKKRTKIFGITAASIKLQDASFLVEGSATLSEPANVDFKFRGEKPDFNLVTAFLPGDVKETLKPFQYDGRLYFDGLIKGAVSDDELPLIEVTFGCEDAWFLNTGADKKIDQLGFKGYYTNGPEHSLRTSELHIINVSARPEKGIFKGNFVVRDFTDPHTLVQVRSELELRFLGEFLGIPGLKQLTGKIKLDMDFKELTGIELPEQSLNKLKEGVQSQLSVEDLSFHIPGYPHPVRDMNLRAEMKDGRITLDAAYLRIGNSDLHLNGSISDIRAFLHDHAKAVTLTLNANSKKILFRELFAYDTALSRKVTEEIQDFNIGLTLETSVDQLLHPSPLPRGNFEIKDLSASFKKYPHAFKDLGARVIINDTTLVLRNLTGMIDQSDFRFSGRVKNYQLWFDEFKKGRTQIAFDFKSNHFALKDVLGPLSRKYVPRGYRREELGNVWLRAKVDLRYDTVFRFAKAHISNITGDLQKHNLKLKDIKGNVKYGARVLILDSLTGTIGRSDFDINLRLFAGTNKQQKKRTNSLVFRSKFLDADEISNYDLAPRTGRRSRATAKADSSMTSSLPTDSSAHAKAFNIFTIPFSDFNAQIEVGKLKYNKLWLKDISARVRMQEDHHLYIDTLAMKVAGGTVRIKGHLNGSDTSKIYFRSRMNVEQVDLEKMMLKLDHFGQDVAINKNIKGRFSGEIKSYVQVHPNFVPIMSKTKANLKVTIFDGSLIDFAPMQAMAGYFKDKNLRMVRFDTLRNELSFTNGELTIPNMNINSSIGFIQVSGKQSLDLNMEYYVRVPVKMVTKAGFNSLFARKTEEVDASQVDEIEYADKKYSVHEPESDRYAQRFQGRVGER